MIVVTPFIAQNFAGVVGEEIMMVHLHGFDWAIYTQSVMPAFTLWLTKGDSSGVYQLYKETRCAQEEQFMPEAMQPLCAWPRACEFIQQLPRGPYARREYQKLCEAEQFTLVSDRYVHRHPPQLYRESEALRTIWGAIVEEYCLPWLQVPSIEDSAEDDAEDSGQSTDLVTERHELLAVLDNAGLQHVIHDINQHPASPTPAQDEGSSKEIQDREPGDEDQTEEKSKGPQGIAIGRVPTTLHLRGWLAQKSLRAMALFELLACGRRGMPFGYHEGDPYGSYAGYLTTLEVRQCTLSLEQVEVPDHIEAENDYLLFRQERFQQDESSRMIDEVLPAHVKPFLQALHLAEQQGLGLLCSLG